MKNIFKLGSVFMAIALLISTLLLSGVFASAEQKNLLVNGDFKVTDMAAEDFGWADGGISKADSTLSSGSFTLKNGNSGAKGLYQAIAFDTAKEYTLSLDVTVTSGTLDIRLYDQTGKTKIASVAEYAAGTTGNQTVKFTPGEGAARIYLGGSNALFTITSAVLTDGSTEETTTASAAETTATAAATETTATAAATEAEPTATEAEPTATEATTYVPIRSWSDTNGMDEIEFNGEGHTSSIYLRKAVVGTAGTWGEFTAAMGSIDEDQYIEVVYTGTFTGVAADTTYFKSRVWQETVNKTYAVVSASDSEIVIRVNGPLTYAEPTDPNFSTSLKVSELSDRANTHFTLTVYGKGEPTATGAEPTATGAEPTATEVEPTATGAEPTATGAEPTATGAEPTATGAEPTATGAEPTATEAEKEYHAIDSWSASSVGYTWLNPNNGSGQVQVYAHIQGNKGTWGDFATTWAELADNQCIEIVYTGTFAGVTKDAVSFDSRVWNETTKSNDFIVSASDNEIVVRLAGPLTSKLMDPNLGLFFAENSLTAISSMEDTSVVVTVLEEGTEPTEPTTESTEPIVDPTGTEPTTESTEPIVDPTGTEPSESTPSQSETTPSESKTEPSQPSVILGDANGDGAVNMKDVLNARKYLAGIDTEIDMVAADVNRDGAVNMKDVLQLRKFLAGLIESFGE